jgi:hypothetical protein
MLNEGEGAPAAAPAKTDEKKEAAPAKEEPKPAPRLPTRSADKGAATCRRRRRLPR